MRVILAMAVSANGMIAGTDDRIEWISGIRWAHYIKGIEESGYFIVWRRTYESFADDPPAAFSNANVIAISDRTDVRLISEKHSVASSPREAIARINDKNAGYVLVSGWPVLSAEFIENDLVDEIVLDIEPILLGQGVPLIYGEDFARRIELLGTRMLSDHEIQLRYRVVRGE